MNKYWKKAAVIVAVAGIALPATACSSSATLVSYKDEKITQDEHYRELKSSQAGKSTLANMIIYRALKQQYGRKVSQKQVDREYNAYKEQYGSSFESALEQNGHTTSNFKKDIETNSLTVAALKDIKKITSKQERKAWKNYQSKVTVQHILVSKRLTVGNIIKQLKNGTSFVTLAKKYSTDSATKDRGGKLAALDSTDTTLDSDFKTTIFKLKIDEYTITPVKTQSGYEIIKMVKHPSKGKLSNHKKEIDEQIYQSMERDTAAMQSVIRTVPKKPDISIKDKDLSNVLSSYMSTTTSSTTGSN